jgi:ubiquinone/menaquinone biosynthesis C-methylase UbiE
MHYLWIEAHQMANFPLIGSVLPLSEVTPGSRLLDLGCGGGTIRYADYPAIRFVGIDQYRDPRSRSWPHHAALVLADGDHLPFADGSFDGAICNFVFEHFAQPEPTLRELNRVIAPHGFLYISIPFSQSLHDRLYRFALRGGGHVQRYSFEGFLRMIYKETSFKMRAFAPMQSGFNWVQNIPLSSTVYQLLFRGLRALAKAGVFPWMVATTCSCLHRVPIADTGPRRPSVRGVEFPEPVLRSLPGNAVSAGSGM